MSSSFQRSFALAGAALFLGFLLCCACAPEWRVNPQYGYGWFVPLILFYLLLVRLREFSEQESPPRLRSSTVAMVGGLLLLALAVEWTRLQHPPMRLIMGMQGGIWFLFLIFAWRDFSIGVRRGMLFPALLLLTVIPWPTRIEEPLTRALMSWVTGIAMELIHFAGIASRREGELIILSNGVVGVSEACSGIRSLQAAFVFSLILGEWRQGSITRRGELFLVGIGLALLGNLLRTLGLCGIASFYGMESMERWHDFSGNLLLMTIMGGLVGWSFWRIRQQEREGSEQELGAALRRLGHHRCVGMTVILMLALCLLGGMRGAVYFQQKAEGVESSPSVQWIRSEGDRTLGITSEVWRNLRCHSGEWIERQGEGIDFEKMEFYRFYWKPIRDSQGVRLHRPDWCMKGLGWKRVGEPIAGEMEVEGGKLHGYWIHYRKPGGEAIQFWTLLRNQERVEVDFNTASLVEEMSLRTFLIPREERSSWEMISLVVSSPWMVPEQKQVEEIGRKRIQKISLREAGKQEN